MVFAELTGFVAQRLQDRSKRHGLVWYAHVGSSQAYGGQTGANRQFAGNVVRTTRCATGFRIVVGKAHALSGKLVEVGCLAGHDALMIGADVEPADIVTHDDKDIGRALLLLCKHLCACRIHSNEHRKQTYADGPSHAQTPFAD